MSDLFAMQRANGDWFALNYHGRLRVPLFHSFHDAMMARLRNFGLLLFKPVVLDAQFLEEIVPSPGEDQVDFCMIENPFTSLECANTVGLTELALLVLPSDEYENDGSD
jgi:hypothetical protein